MAISSVAASAAASNAQTDASIALAQAKSVDQQSQAARVSSDQTSNPVTQAPSVKPSLNSNGETIGTTISVSA